MTYDEKQIALANKIKKTFSIFSEVQKFIEPSFEDATEVDFLAVAKNIVAQESLLYEDPIERLSLAQVEEKIRECRKCVLCEQRNNVVIGEGDTNARLMLIGEGPGKEEDLSGRPFVGNSGKYLDSWLNAINLNRQQSVYITNVVKCRAPSNRDPKHEESLACYPYLKRQIALIKPEVILILGKVAANFLLQNSDSLFSMRQKVHRLNAIPVVVTYHPAAVLRNFELRKEVWQDLQLVASVMNLPIAKKGR
jgi:uracil-DNA glycosylase family 4